LSIIIIGFGTSLYYNRKIIQHAGSFSFETFFIQ